MRILPPPADSNSIRHSGPAVAGATSSTNLGRRGVFDFDWSAATSSRFSLPASRRSCWAARLTPCCRAALMATVHNSSGIGDFPVRPLLHCSKRVRAASMLLVSTTCSDILFSSLNCRRLTVAAAVCSVHAPLPKGHDAAGLYHLLRHPLLLTKLSKTDGSSCGLQRSRTLTERTRNTSATD